MTHLSPEQIAGFDALDAAGRAEALDHAASCTDCRQRLVDEEPSRLFALLVLEPIPVERLEALSRRVSDALDGTPALAAQRPWVRRLSVAASLALALILGSRLLPPAFEAPETARVPGQVETIAVSSAGATGAFDVMYPPEAEVFEFSLGDTEVRMIFDEGLDL